MNFSSLPFPALLDQVRQIAAPDQPVYLVGGALRDLLLGRPIHDLDFVLPQDALGVSRRVAGVLRAAFYPLDHSRDMGRCILSQEDGSRLILDFASLRGHNLDQDLRGRDFTINAMAVDLRVPGVWIDPLGGAQDLHDKRLRACSERSFLDDPVRILRGIRLAVSLGMHIEPHTRRWLRQATPSLLVVSPERVRDELFRILEGPQPATALRTLDILEVIRVILPELAALKGVVQSPPHVSDVWSHTINVVQRLEQLLDVLTINPAVKSGANWTLGMVSLRLGRYRQQLFEHFIQALNPDRNWRSLLFLAALYHDSGKPLTGQVDEKGRIRFFEHEKVSARLAGEAGARFRLSNDEINYLKVLTRGHLRPILLSQSNELPSRRAIYRFFRDYGQAGVDICLLSLADILATYGPTLPQDAWIFQLDVVRALLTAWWEHPEVNVAPTPLLNGRDLVQLFNLTPGPQIGFLLEAVREAQATGQIHSRDEAITLVRQQLNAL